MGEGRAFRFRKHKIYEISNAFSAIQGAQISKFPGVGGIPLASECFHVHVNPISTCVSRSVVPPHAHFPLSIPDESFPIWTGYSENGLAQ